MKFDYDFEELFLWLALNTDKRRIEMKYIPSPVSQCWTKIWAFFLEVLKCSEISLPPEIIYISDLQDKG